MNIDAKISAVQIQQYIQRIKHMIKWNLSWDVKMVQYL